jgi:hypothetical protein
LQSATGNSLGVDSRRFDLSSCKISNARGSVLPSTPVREADRLDAGAPISTERTVPLIFTASETFDVGMDTLSPVANDYFDQAPFEFEGTLKRLYFSNLE